MSQETTTIREHWLNVKLRHGFTAKEIGVPLRTVCAYCGHGWMDNGCADRLEAVAALALLDNSTIVMWPIEHGDQEACRVVSDPAPRGDDA